ncbi:DUF6497 family protein [Lentibacter sp. XHP0401]|jgi:Family of unknown function (DUF6497)|uniref:DUF6497 family protein n=1 Tax=Lentibacter sp. XHP0401 TaxID=2984334 RepID=UPI0021E8362B|nr:DUF6497 family protein [Lentibacter sp. XHP0401]MCV2891583.1 DUF6497 family protein [Lentibacter sp. XHP0401]
MRSSPCFLLGCIGLAFAGLPAGAQGLPSLPSGLAPVLLEEFIEVKPDGMFTYARFRFVAPEIGQSGAQDYEALVEDFMMLCQDYAVPRLVGNPEHIDRVIISYADRALEFGVSDADATQYFEQFTLQNDICIWEQF